MKTFTEEDISNMSADDLLRINPYLHQAVGFLIRGCSDTSKGLEALYHWDRFRSLPKSKALFNGLTEEETNQTASCLGLVNKL